ADLLAPVGDRLGPAEAGSDLRERVSVPAGDRDELGQERRVELTEGAQRAGVRLPHEGVPEHADADLASLPVSHGPHVIQGRSDSPAASIAAEASAASSAPGRPLTPTAPTLVAPANAATPPRKNVKNGSKLARSTGSSFTFSASAFVEVSS